MLNHRMYHLLSKTTIAASTARINLTSTPLHIHSPRTTSTTHHILHTNTSHYPSLVLAHMQVWDGILFVVYLGCTPVLDQVQQIYPELYIFPKLIQVKQNLTHSNTLTNTLTKTRTNTWPTDNHLHLQLNPSTYKYTQLTPQIHPRMRPQKTPTNTLTAELLCPCYHVTW